MDSVSPFFIDRINTTFVSFRYINYEILILNHLKKAKYLARILLMKSREINNWTRIKIMLQANLKNPIGRGQTKNLHLINRSFAESLQLQVANSFNLYLNYKFYHWQTNGPLVRDLNIIFDEFAAESYNTVDKLADRIRTIGFKKVRLTDFPNTSVVKPAQAKNDERRMLEEARLNELIIVQGLSELVRKSKHIDPVSTKILSELLVIHNKHHWWLDYILEKRQGIPA